MAALFTLPNPFSSPTLQTASRSYFSSSSSAVPPLHQLSAASLSTRRARRGSSLVAGAGPTSTQYIFAFVFPITLVAVTIFTSIKIDEKLDQDFLEDLAMKEAYGEDAFDPSLDQEPTMPLEKSEAPRFRNRPRREA